VLGWSNSLLGLRGPSLAFFLLALPGVGLVALELAGAEIAAAVVLLTAVSPIPYAYTTFGRPHTMLFAWLMWATVPVLRAARTASRRWWIVGGAALGASVFVHPTAPLYALTAFGCALLYAPRPWRTLVREAWPGAVALLVVFVPYYAKTLHVLGDRYGVGQGSKQGGARTFSGRPVWEDALHFAAPGTHDLNYFTVLGLVGLVVLLRRRRRLALFCTLTVLAPVVFFSYVPATGRAALFFDRYMIPVIPAFLVVVCVGCAAIAGWAGRARLLIFVVLIAGLYAVELRIDLDRRGGSAALHLNGVTAAVKRAAPGSVLFSTTGSAQTGNPAGSFSYGRPATLLDRYLSLRIPSLALANDDDCILLRPFLRAPPVHGMWLFYAALPDQDAAAAATFAKVSGMVVTQPEPDYFLVRTATAQPPRVLLREGIALRKRWKQAVPANKRAQEMIEADEAALTHPATCVPQGPLGDPDISPDWPLHKGA
jgi:Dolichyl-phosphate-mannose-protein mannosyltransferase